MSTNFQAGVCRCGATQFEVSGPPLMTAACHCRECRKMSSSAFSLTAMVDANAFRVVSGAPVRGGLRGPNLEHYCCPECMSWMFTRIVGVEFYSGFVSIRPTMLEDTRWTLPFIETMTEEKLPWVHTAARHAFTQYPDPETFRGLLDEFPAAWSATASRDSG